MMMMMMFCPNDLREIFVQAFRNETLLEAGHTMKEAVRKDALAWIDRDPACETLLEVVLFYKGFAALVCHRAARQKWLTANDPQNNKRPRRSMTALFLQSQASAVFALDIHPAATIGAGILLDHGTGIVIGETAHIGDGCTLLHGVTLGGTGKESGDRHPKVGKHVLIGAGSSILGNIRIGNRAKIGAGSVVLRDIPPGATAVGAPAKIIGRTLEDDPASTVDERLQNVGLFHKSASAMTLPTVAPESSEGSTGLDTDSDNNQDDDDDGHAEDDNDDGQHHVSCCPYRDYAKLAHQQNAPRDSITFCTVAKHLKNKGCTHDQIWPVFFAMDTRNVGYVYPRDCDSSQVSQILRESTLLNDEDIKSVLHELEIASE
jgi:serine O-acetyltransferase